MGQTPPSVTLAWNADSSPGVVSYNLYSGSASQSYTNVISAGNTTNVTVSGLVSGATYYFAVTAIDATGLESMPSAEVSYTVPLTNTTPPPAVVLAAPASGASYLAPASISLVASVTPNGHTVTSVQFLNGTVLLGVSSSTPYSLLWSNVSAGNYSLSAQVIYDSGSNAWSAPVTVLVTNAPPSPVVVLTAPTTGASYTAPANITLSANFTPNGHAITKVQFMSGSAVLGESATAPYSFVWNNVSAGTYSLSAQAVYDAGSLALSAPATVAVSGLPAPWQTLDIGAVGLPGSAAISNGLYTASGSGSLSGGSDSFRFLYQTLSADGEIRGQINSVQPASGNGGCVGALVRENLTSGSRYALMGITPGGGFRWQRRANTGGGTATTKAGAATLPNVWVRVARIGNTLYGYKSVDGVNWTLVNSSTIAMSANAYVGWAVASGSSGALVTAVLTNVMVVP